MLNKVIITIARQYGSAGREIGKKLAEQLTIPYYDEALIKLASQESGINESLFESADEKPMSSLWESASSFNVISLGGHFPAGGEMPMNDKLFLIQSKVIKELAEAGSCVIVGRCADYILADNPNAVHVFIHAKEEVKLKRVVESYGIPEGKAKEVMFKTDRKRSTYYNYYADGKWGRAENYDLTIDSSIIGIDGTVKLIKEFAQLKLSK